MYVIESMHAEKSIIPSFVNKRQASGDDPETRQDEVNLAIWYSIIMQQTR